MATESPIWIPSHKEAAFSPSTRNVSIEDLGLLRTPTFAIPNRSGSAPPSMEGSFLAVNDLISQQNSSRNQRVGSTAHYFELDKQSNTAYCGTNVNPTSRLPTLPIPKENRSPGHHFDKFGGSRRASVDSNCRSSFQPQATLSTHKEESEDDRSTELPFDDRNDKTNRPRSSEDAGSWSGQTKSLVDTIQEDFPRTPSPVFNQLHSLSSVTTDEPTDNDGDSSSLHDYPVSVSSVAVSTANIDSVRPSLSVELSSASVASTSSLNYSSYSQPPPLAHKGNSTIGNLASIESGMNNLAISGPRIANQDQWHQSYQRNLQQNQVYQQQNTPFQLHGVKSQIGSQGAVSPYIGMDQFLHGTQKFSTEVQPILQSSGFTPPLYTTAAAYMTAQNPCYANLQASGLYHQQYGTSGYTSSSGVVPPYLTGYPHAAIPVVYDGPAGPNFSGRVSAPPAGTSVAQGGDMQHFNKFYAPLGYTVQTPFVDSSYMQYYHQPFAQVYNLTGQFDPLMSGSVYGSQNIFPEVKKGAEVVPGLDDHKSQNQKSGVGNHNHVRGGVINPHYTGNQPNMGLVMQYPPPPLAASVLPGSASSGAMFAGGRSDTRLPPVTGRYATLYSGWQGQREADSFNEPKIFNFLEELKSGKGRRFELSDIAGHIVEFSTDQHGSRFIQQKLESCSAEEKAAVFKEVLPYAAKLMTDVFGNYVIQKFFEYGSTDQRKELANQLGGQILPLSLQMYGCRVIQKALDVIELDQKAQLIQELDGHVIRCVRDQNGNHVIQKCIESITAEKIGFIIAAFRGQVATLSTHPYGCRVVQRVLEHCPDDLHFQFIVDEILESVYSLSQDQYGNYVTQHVLERGKHHERFQIVSRLSGHIVQLSQHKFASNVIEKCLEYGGSNERGLIFDEVLGQTEGNDNLLIMMKDQYANYVVQKILDTCTPSQQLLLLNRIRPHVHALKKYTYGKHIVGRFEQQFGEDQAS